MIFVLFRFSFLLFLVCINLDAKQTSPTLDYLNTIRYHSGLIPFKPSRELSNAAKSHALYLVEHQQNGHYEYRGKKGYRGKTPSDRVIEAGYASRVVMENVTVNTKTSFESIDTLFAAIYHRFVFLNFDKNEIGIGEAFATKSRAIVSAFVYNIGSESIRKLCESYYPKRNGFFYMENLCKESSMIVPEYLFVEKNHNIRLQNTPIVLHPYPNAKEVTPVFYTENPHPLPGSEVSGYPISVQFNPASYSEVVLKKFRLFSENGREIKQCKIFTRSSDPNHLFSKLQFALMPLKRLEYGMIYRVEFEALADGERVVRRWSFTTKRPQGKLFKIMKKQTMVKVKKGEKIVLYFEPRSRKDVLRGIRCRGRFKVIYLDRNTLEVTLSKGDTARSCTLKAGDREVVLEVYKAI